MSRVVFEFHGTAIAERGMQTLAIVPSFDVLEDGGASQCPRSKRIGGAFKLEGAEEAFHRSIVVTISDSTHANLAVINSQTLQIGITGVLAALVGVMQQVC